MLETVVSIVEEETKFVNTSLPYWMRMNGGGIGMLGSSYVHR